VNKTLKKCNYNAAHVVVTESLREIHSVNGGQTIIFPQETSENVARFRKELIASISRSRRISGAQSEITSIWCDGTKEFKGIRLSKRVFTQSKIDTIINKIEREHSVKLTFTKTRGRQPADWFQFSCISW
jgi:hypothetical protein